MLDADEPQRSEDEDQEEFSVSNPSHDSCTDMKEFSELLARVPTKILWGELMTHQQRLFAISLWEATNYGGKPKPGDFRHMEDKRLYAEWVLKMDHVRQWNKAKERGKL